MEVLNCPLKRQVVGGFLSSCQVKRRNGKGVQISTSCLLMILLFLPSLSGLDNLFKLVAYVV